MIYLNGKSEDLKPRSSGSPFLTQSQQQIALCLYIGLSVLLHGSKERLADMKEMKGYKENPPFTQKYWAANPMQGSGIWTGLIQNSGPLNGVSGNYLTPDIPISSNPFIPRLCICFLSFLSLHLHSPEHSLYFHAPGVVYHLASRKLIKKKKKKENSSSPYASNRDPEI